MNEKKIIVGRFGKVVGLKGWIKVISFTDPPENILNYKTWLIEKSPKEWQKITYLAHRKHYHHLLVQLPNCTNCEKAKNYTNLNIAVPHSTLPPKKENEFYWCDLENLEVINRTGTSFGKVAKVINTGANDILIVKDSHNKETLIPFIKNTIDKVDTIKKIIYVDWEE